MVVSQRWRSISLLVSVAYGRSLRRRHWVAAMEVFEAGGVRRMSLHSSSLVMAISALTRSIGISSDGDGAAQSLRVDSWGRRDGFVIRVYCNSIMVWRMVLFGHYSHDVGKERCHFVFEWFHVSGGYSALGFGFRVRSPIYLYHFLYFHLG